MKDTRILGDQDGKFPSTHWSAIQKAKGSSAAARQAMEMLALQYWRPVYLHIRRRWRMDIEEAKDLTQSFFLTLLESGTIERADPDRGRFRTFLMTCLDNMLRNRFEAAQAKKRGGGRTRVPLEHVEEEKAAPVETPSEERPTEIRRKRALGRALDRLRDTLTFEGKGVQFQVFIEHEMPEGEAAPSYQELSRRHGVPVTTITNYLHRVRTRLRDVLLEMLQEGPPPQP